MTSSQFERDPIVLGWPGLLSSWPLRQSLKILQLSIAIQLAASHRGARAIARRGQSRKLPFACRWPLCSLCRCPISGSWIEKGGRGRAEKQLFCFLAKPYGPGLKINCAKKKYMLFRRFLPPFSIQNLDMISESTRSSHPRL